MKVNAIICALLDSEARRSGSLFATHENVLFYHAAILIVLLWCGGVRCLFVPSLLLTVSRMNVVHDLRVFNWKTRFLWRFESTTSNLHHWRTLVPPTVLAVWLVVMVRVLHEECFKGHHQHLLVLSLWTLLGVVPSSESMRITPLMMWSPQYLAGFLQKRIQLLGIQSPGRAFSRTLQRTGVHNITAVAPAAQDKKIAPKVTGTVPVSRVRPLASSRRASCTRFSCLKRQEDRTESRISGRKVTTLLVPY